MTAITVNEFGTEKLMIGLDRSHFGSSPSGLGHICGCIGSGRAPGFCSGSGLWEQWAGAPGAEPRRHGPTLFKMALRPPTGVGRAAALPPPPPPPEPLACPPLAPWARWSELALTIAQMEGAVRAAEAAAREAAAVEAVSAIAEMEGCPSGSGSDSCGCRRRGGP